jgi:hypothetical protein
MWSFLDFIRELFVGKEMPLIADIGPAPGSAPIKLGLVIGHSQASQGATMNTFGQNSAPRMTSEYRFNKDIMVPLIKKEGARNGVQVMDFYRDGTTISGAVKKAVDWKADCIIELHLNAFNGVVEGTEVLSTPDQNDRKLSGLVLAELYEVFRAGDAGRRGVKILKQADRGATNIYAAGSIPNVLVEPVFADNPKEGQLLWDKRANYAAALISGVKAYFA